MPHFIVEYSANIAGELDVPTLLEQITKTAAETGVFPLGGIRTRAVRREEYHVADGAEENAYVYVTAHVGQGRDRKILENACERIFDTVTSFLTPIYETRPLSIGFDVMELDTVYSGKKNNIHEKLRGK